MTKCDHIIGWYTENGPDSYPVHLDKREVKELNSMHSIGEYKFRFCPLCGAGIDWDNIEELLRLKEL